jgi:hypothetical protein
MNKQNATPEEIEEASEIGTIIGIGFVMFLCIAAAMLVFGG